MPTVLVTGANGFLGSHIVRELSGRGYAIRALVRAGSLPSTHTRQMLSDSSVSLHVGDLRHPATIEAAAIGCDAVIHAAALAQVNPARSPAVWETNLGGTQTVLRAARRAGVSRFVYVGTANVFGFGTREQPGDETCLFAGHAYGLDYIDSKWAATQCVLRAVREWDLPAVLVHPTYMLGPLDAKPTSGRLLLELYRGRVTGYPAGGKNYVHVRDVATATVNALGQGRVGESYILGHQNLSYHDAFDLIARVLGGEQPRWAIPPRLARLYAHGCEGWATLTGQTARLNRAMIAVANDGHYFTAQKALTELSLPQTSIQTAVEEAFDWFQQNNYVANRPLNQR